MVLFKEELGLEPVIAGCALIALQCIIPVGHAARWNCFMHEVRVEVHQLRVRIRRVEHAREVECFVVLAASDTTARIEAKDLLQAL